MVPFTEWALFPFKIVHGLGKRKTHFVLMSHDVIWGQFVPFPPYLCPPPPHPHPRLVLRPKRASPPASFPKWAYYPTHFPKSWCPVLSHQAGGGDDTREFLLCNNQGVGREAMGPWLGAQDSDLIAFIVINFCWEGQCVLGPEAPWGQRPCLSGSEVYRFSNKNHHWPLTCFLLKAPPKSCETYENTLWFYIECYCIADV